MNAADISPKSLACIKREVGYLLDILWLEHNETDDDSVLKTTFLLKH